MQQHSGQHVLSAAFEKLYGLATVSFHMGEESCTIDLAADSVSAKQLRAAERLANEVIAEDRPVEIRFATPEEARSMGVRKIPPVEREKLRLIDIRDFDLNACGGTHVRSTGQIGGILLRKTEKVKQGVRVEFVCGLRAVATARHDFETLTEAAALFSTHIWEVPQQIRKWQDESQGSAKSAASFAGGSRRVAGRTDAATGRATTRLQAGDAVFRRTRSRLHQDAGPEADEGSREWWRCCLVEGRSRRWSSRRRRAWRTTWAR